MSITPVAHDTTSITITPASRTDGARTFMRYSKTLTWKKHGRTTNSPSEAKQWRKTIKEKIREREETQWRERMQHKPKLRTYRQLKTELRFETYLTTKDRSERSDDETERRNE